MAFILIIPFIAAISIIIILSTSAKEKKNINDNRETNVIPYGYYYQARTLLTKHEWYEHNKLRTYAAQRNLTVCPKVRLLDIIEPKKEFSNQITFRAKVQSKHVDFVLCDINMNVVAILELDDDSHNRPDRQARDAFVNHILTSVGYTVIHTRAITETTLDVLNFPSKGLIYNTDKYSVPR